MTSCATNWLALRSGAYSTDRIAVRAFAARGHQPPRLESLESRQLPSNASGVWSFAK